VKRTILFLLCAIAACADDGMWLFNQFPTDAVKQKHEIDVTPAFLDHLRQSTVKLPGGSGAFVSKNGLLLTNWHVVNGCVPNVDAGPAFYAASQDAEIRCPGLNADVLVAMEEVTAKVKAGIKDDTPVADALTKRNAAITAIESECVTKTHNVCVVGNLYSGGRYDLYQYRRYSDLRLVFAPEQPLAFFGRERDSITYLRYGLDAAFVRAYKNGKPAETPVFLKWNSEMVKDGDLVFAAGSPLTTSRSTTVAQLNFYRDTALPITLSRVGSRIKPINKFSAQSEDNKKVAEPVLKDLLATYKSVVGKLIGLRDQRLQIRKTLFEQKIRNAVERDPKLGTEGAKVWDQVATAYKNWAHYEKTYQILDGSPAPGSTLFRVARRLVEGQDPGGDADTPVNEGLETTLLSQYLAEIKDLNEKDAPIKAILHGKEPEQVAESIVKSSKLGDPAVRRRYAADHASVGKSEDGLLRLALQLEEPARRIRAKRQELIGALEVSAAEKIAGYRLKLFGAADYPDATGTPRVSFGVLKGYTDRAGTPQPYASTFSGLFYRRNNEGPHMVPRNWVDLQESLNNVTPLDFVSTCDIGGGGYGAPTVNTAGELVGIIFDGNLESLPATYLYMEDQARAVHVAAQGIVESLDKVYNASALLQELGIKRKGPTSGPSS
jgi:Peptidase S46